MNDQNQQPSEEDVEKAIEELLGDGESPSFGDEGSDEGESESDDSSEETPAADDDCDEGAPCGSAEPAPCGG